MLTKLNTPKTKHCTQKVLIPFGKAYIKPTSYTKRTFGESTDCSTVKPLSATIQCNISVSKYKQNSTSLTAVRADLQRNSPSTFGEEILSAETTATMCLHFLGFVQIP
jgi:hypothetical protein